MKTRILVSACLLGFPTRYDGKLEPLGSDVLSRWVSEGRVVTACPEVDGGLATPRPAAEIRSAETAAVLDGEVSGVTEVGCDVTDAFVAGAKRALALCREHGLKLALMKEYSPSCGLTQVHNGEFAQRLRPGAGVAVELLHRNGIRVFSELEIALADEALRTADSDDQWRAGPEGK